MCHVKTVRAPWSVTQSIIIHAIINSEVYKWWAILRWLECHDQWCCLHLQVGKRTSLCGYNKVCTSKQHPSCVYSFPLRKCVRLENKHNPLFWVIFKKTRYIYHLSSFIISVIKRTCMVSNSSCSSDFIINVVMQL